MNYELTLEDRDTYPFYSYFYEEELDTIYFNVSWLKHKKGYLQQAKLLDLYFLKDFICIQSECYKDGCENCPIEKVITRCIL